MIPHKLKGIKYRETKDKDSPLDEDAIKTPLDEGAKNTPLHEDAQYFVCMLNIL